MNTLILLIIEILLILFAILIHVLWGIFPEWGSTIFFILLTLDLIIMLGLFIWYLIIYKNEPCHRNVIAPKRRQILVPMRPTSVTMPPLPERLPPRSSSSSSSTSRSRSGSCSVQDAFSIGERSHALTAAGHAPTNGLGCSRRVIFDGSSTPLRSVKPSYTPSSRSVSPVTKTRGESPPISPIPVIVGVNGKVIGYIGDLVEKFQDLSKLYKFDSNTIANNDTNNATFKGIVAGMDGISEMNLSDIETAYNNNDDLTPELLATVFIGAYSSEKESIIYVTSTNSFYVLYKSRTGLVVSTFKNDNIEGDSLDLINQILNSPDSLKLYMTSENKVGIMSVSN